MRFSIDLDGVIANFNSCVVKVANTLWPGKLPEGFQPDTWEYTSYLTSEEVRQIFAVIKQTPYFWENESQLPGLVELQQGVTKDDEIFFITSRMTTVGEGPQIQSIRWLHERRLWARGGHSTVLQVADPAHKQHLFQGLGLKYHLDDYAPTVSDLNAIGVAAFLLDQPWNQYADALPRVRSVTEYLNIVRERETANR